jgi:hypothetical protein
VGGQLRSYDLLTGELIQSLPVTGITITGLARDGSFLYTLDASTGSNGFVTLASGYTTVDVSNPDSPQATGALPATTAAGQAITVNGSGIALTVGNDFYGPAVNVFDASSPTNGHGHRH